MTTLETLRQERQRFAEIVRIKKRHIEEYKKVLNFYVKQVQELDRKIKELECQKNTQAEAASAKAPDARKALQNKILRKCDK